MVTYTLLLQLFLATPVADTAKPFLYDAVDVKPYSDDLNYFVIKYLHWPPERYDFSRTIFVSAIIEKNGQVTNVHIRVAEDNEAVNKAAMKVVEQLPKMPCWSPGKIKGKPVRTLFDLPLRFCPQE